MIQFAILSANQYTSHSHITEHQQSPVLQKGNNFHRARETSVRWGTPVETGQENQGRWRTPSNPSYQWKATEATRETKTSIKSSVLPYAQAKYLGKEAQVMDEQGWLQIIVLVLLISSPLGGPYTNTGHFSALISCYISLPHSEINHLESWCGSVTLIKLCFAPESCICSVCTVCKLYKLQEKLISVIQISAQLLKLTVNTNYTASFQCCWEAPHTKHVTKFTEVDTKTRKNKLENITDNRSQGNFAQKNKLSPKLINSSWLLFRVKHFCGVCLALFAAVTAPLAAFSYHRTLGKIKVNVL